MPTKVFVGEEYPADGFTCDIVIIGDYNKVLIEATDHFSIEHGVDPDSQLISQTIRDYNESQDGQPHSCSHV